MIQRSDVFGLYQKFYKPLLDKFSPAMWDELLDGLQRAGAGVSDFERAFSDFRENDKSSEYPPDWPKLRRHLHVQSNFDADKAAWDWIIERITMDGWRAAMRQFFSECGGTGHGYEKDTLCRQRLITAGINSKSMAYGPDGVFPAKIVEFWMILHGESNPGKAYAFIGNKKLADLFNAMPIERQRTYFNFTREERFNGLSLPLDVKNSIARYMASMRQRSEAMKETMSRAAAW